MPRTVHSVVRSILWKKLPLADRMHSMQMADTDQCPLCHRKEDHEHRVKKCPYVEQPIQVIRDLFRLDCHRRPDGAIQAVPGPPRAFALLGARHLHVVRSGCSMEIQVWSEIWQN